MLGWAEKFRQGRYGVYGDLTNVVEGVAELKIFEVPASTVTRQDQPVASTGVLESSEPRHVSATATSSPGMRKVVINVKPGAIELPKSLHSVKPVQKVGISGGRWVRGPFLQHVGGSGGTVARVTVREGMWAPPTPVKVDGGERRKAEVRAKRRVQERKLERS